ncbi:VOC family protein [Cesiribacter sp. SM1]|uniref:VOC family protein n=1 Tax=Cesiribacter sp. SM1 TaxID=2861196 RepID=UPI001CD19CDD|nr:VOC family protein [Cesiribacter sp. SM1]
MEIGHIFIFSDSDGAEADELLSFGLQEGSNRVHPGQGTRNRKFYFENFYLEILWVNNVNDITNPLTAPTKLWERANHLQNGSSPFGLCLEYSADTDRLFEGCLKYQPVYLPEGMAIEVITNQENPYLPWTFRWPPMPGMKKAEEPVDHQPALKKLTKIRFGIPETHYQNAYTSFFGNNGKISFEPAPQHHLTLYFDEGRAGQRKTFHALPLTMAY